MEDKKIEDEKLGSCMVKFYDKSGKTIEVAGSFEVVDGIPHLYFDETSVPSDFNPVKVEAYPIIKN